MPLSIVECLPAELIQPIFRQSGYNVSLPLASPHIAAKLSGERIYNEVCDHHLTTQDPLERVQRKINQTRIFAAKWMTWDYFKSWVLRQYEPKRCLCGRTEDDGCWDRQWPINWQDVSQMPFSRAHLPELAWVNGRLPRKLFVGKWTQEKIEFLRFLLWITSMTVDWRDDEMRNIVVQSRKNAILQGSLDAVELFNHNRRLGKTPDLAWVLFTVIEGGCNRSIVYDTMATAYTLGGREDWASDELDKWCASRVEAGDPKGAWLQQKLEGLRAKPSKELPSQASQASQDPQGSKAPQELQEGGSKPPTETRHIDPKEGSYEAEGDNLVVNNLKWNETKAFVGWNVRVSGTIDGTPLYLLRGIHQRFGLRIARTWNGSNVGEAHARSLFQYPWPEAKETGLISGPPGSTS
ncbi:unnamed protein product [Periconia digitata]|uniref:Uncharacterized protein n=1 Tax=Periconia digitata TaxID=1303443 RepID=A0A9W4XPQ7_9PLEO|nr:unnamed protein product [Periconia digitata]